MQQVSEKELREAIRHFVSDQENRVLKEQTRSYTINISASQLWDALVQPWIEVLKIAKLEAQKTLANLLTLFRVMTSFNRQKIQNIMDAHKTRMRGLNAETQQLLEAMPISTDMAVLGFLLNPGGYIAMKSSVGESAHGVAEWFRGAGFGDYTAGELGSLDREVVARVRKREQSGFVAKALRGLNSLFMAGYDPGDAMLLEQEEVAEDIPPFEERDYSSVQMTEDGINLIIDENGGLEGIEEAQKGMLEDASSFLKDIKTANQLVSTLGELGSVQSLDDYMAVLGKLQQISPESGMPQRSEIEASLDADAKSISSQEGAEEEAAKMVLGKQGNKEPSEEELLAVTDEEKMAEIRAVAFGNILARLRKSAAEAAQGIYDTHKEAYDVLYPEDVEPGVKKIIDESDYGKLLQQADEVLDAMLASVSSVGV